MVRRIARSIGSSREIASIALIKHPGVRLGIGQPAGAFDLRVHDVLQSALTPFVGRSVIDVTINI